MKKLLNNISVSIWLVVAMMSISCQQDTSVCNFSDVEIIFNYVIKTDYLPNQENVLPFEVAIRFQKYPEENETSNFVIRKQRIMNSFSLKKEPAIRNLLNADCLATPNVSKEVTALRQKISALAIKTKESSGYKGNPVVLSFSSSCPTKDGRRYYYVERTSKDSRYANGNLYILNNCVVERVINIWTT